tara:strand:- start:170 stop:556 length:387 start_codon:yes stop_codon:yes gene_type:complete
MTNDQAKETNDLGSNIERFFVGCEKDRYYFDFVYCTREKGWAQYDTHQDAVYFGVWIHKTKRQILSYCEGDVTIVHCHNDEMLQAEIESLHEFYGAPPPCAVSYDSNGNRTEHYDESCAHGRAIPNSN